MDIIIRDIDAAIVKIIDDRAKEKKVSRNKLLKEILLEEVTVGNNLESKKRYDELLNESIITIRENNELMDTLNIRLEELDELRKV